MHERDVGNIEERERGRGREKKKEVLRKKEGSEGGSKEQK